tara:strand:+ start:18670 stop:19011 length:342 start_codon:yes stop_codon:yes gene_type:complete
MQEREETPLLPSNPANYLTDWLFEIGPTIGEGLVGYQDMAAWQRISGVELMPWEARTLRRLSAEYSAERYRARKANCPPPYSEQPAAVRDRVTEQFAAMMQALRTNGAQAKPS